MNKRYNQLISCSIIILFFCSCFLACNRNLSREDKINNTIKKALAWVYLSPANFVDGGFIEISEEIITFYILSNHTDSPDNKRAYSKQIEERIKLIKSVKDYYPKPPEYTMFLAVASIAEKLGINVYDFRKIIKEKIVSDPQTYPPMHITTNIWNTVFLERMGYSPPRALSGLLQQSTLSHEAKRQLLYRATYGPVDDMMIDQIAITIYNITHEIFALTDFGLLPPPPVIVDNKEFFSDLFNSSINWAINVKHIDVLAELIMCVEILHLDNVPTLHAGIDCIVNSQTKKGTFGVTNPSRPNTFRHGILMSIMALTMYEVPEMG